MLAETIIARDVVPFHAAFNHGLLQVRTPLFIQVDADMVLDATCVESLCAAMTPTVALVVGFLRDALLDRIVGVKLYRTACLRQTPFPGSVSPDSDAVKTLRARGWVAVHALCWQSRHTFGRHEPHYTLLYTYAKFVVTGARHHYRRNGGATRALFRQLCQSAHPLAPLAMAALAHGLFLDASGDLLDARRRWPLPAVLEDFDTLPAGTARSEPVEQMASTRLEEVFARAYHAGRASSGARADVVRAEHARLSVDWSLPSWVSAVGFFHGLLSEEAESPETNSAFTRLALLLPDADRVVR
jgi:hypothetical protein